MMIGSDLQELRLAAMNLVDHVIKLSVGHGLGFGTTFFKFLASFAAMSILTHLGSDKLENKYVDLTSCSVHIPELPFISVLFIERGGWKMVCLRHCCASTFLSPSVSRLDISLFHMLEMKKEDLKVVKLSEIERFELEKIQAYKGSRCSENLFHNAMLRAVVISHTPTTKANLARTALLAHAGAFTEVHQASPTTEQCKKKQRLLALDEVVEAQLGQTEVALGQTCRASDPEASQAPMPKIIDIYGKSSQLVANREVVSGDLTVSELTGVEAMPREDATTATQAEQTKDPKHFRRPKKELVTKELVVREGPITMKEEPVAEWELTVAEGFASHDT
ncbi:uncharacterized protein A4U43_C08F14880 [Asparagus officinalis]|nr:uncharacterized protein A4U43_C08F14880 [Asparagus officinalis]